ncbi:uncharacterized protein LOC114743609 [Neltuma alba]|uniref:uncharacterized protein LOC114743609 n=1 Tax=Neltuma alba TaxID=207710 RepID=UPI0010A2DC5B|nr:uncharacterized protein LOC114743609 [Prosopis alba]
MSANCLSNEYWDRLEDFIKFTVEHADDCSRIICPCLKCCLLKWVSPSVCESYLIINGIDQSYKCWTKHRETRDAGNSSRGHSESCGSSNFDTSTYKADRLKDMANTIEQELKDCPEMFERLKCNAKTPLYKGCTDFTKLSVAFKMYNLKVRNGWSDTSFTELLSLVKQMLPKENKLPSKTCDAKQVLRFVSLSYEKIHACPNNCILFRKEYKSLSKCPKCNTLRYQENGKSLKKALWYFHTMPRFRHLYSNVEDVRNLRWYVDERIKDGMLQHLADSLE